MFIASCKYYFYFKNFTHNFSPRSNDTVEVIPAMIANAQFPQIVIKFYESRIKFKDSPSKK